MSAPDDAALVEALARLVHRPIHSIQRQRSPYSSSFTIEDLEIEFSDGQRLLAVFKNLSFEAMLDSAKAIKPGFLQHPLREIQVYSSLLSLVSLGTPRLYGAVVEPAINRYWLFIEKVPGIALDQIGDFTVWLDVARWLGRFHALDACTTERARRAIPQLLLWNSASYKIWLGRAQRNVRDEVDRLPRRYGRVIEVLESLPRMMIHGEFYAGNILVQQQELGRRVCPVDWEMAAVGPGLLDVAALASGKWTREQRFQLAESYCSVLPKSLRPTNFATAFDCCQLQIALQWLGWSKAWTPPDEHAHDWLGEVARLCSEEPLVRLLT